MRIRPLVGEALVRLIPQEMDGSIHIPDCAQTPQSSPDNIYSKPQAQKARIIELGAWPQKGKFSVLPPAPKGAIVLINPHVGKEVSLGDSKLKIVRYDDLLAVLA